MKKIYKCLIITTVFVMMFSMSAFAETKEVTNQKVILNNKQITFKDPILNIDGRNFFPMRELLNNLGVKDDEINWNANTKTVTFDKNKNISFQVGSNTYNVSNGDKTNSSVFGLKVSDDEYVPFSDITTTMDTKPIIYNSKMYLPIKYILDANHYYYTYDANTKTTSILTDQNDYPHFDVDLGDTKPFIDVLKLGGNTALIKDMKYNNLSFVDPHSKYNGAYVQGLYIIPNDLLNSISQEKTYDDNSLTIASIVVLPYDKSTSKMDNASNRKIVDELIYNDIDERLKDMNITYVTEYVDDTNDRLLIYSGGQLQQFVNFYDGYIVFNNFYTQY